MLAQGGDRSVLDDADGTLTPSENRGGFAGRQVREEPALEDVALRGRQAVDRSPHSFAIRHDLGEHRGIARLGRSLREHLEREVRVGRAVRVDDGVAGDPEQPGRERQAPVLVVRKLFDHLDKHPLEEVFGQFRTVETAPEEPKDPGSERVIEAREGDVVSFMSTGDEVADLVLRHAFRFR